MKKPSKTKSAIDRRNYLKTNSTVRLEADLKNNSLNLVFRRGRLKIDMLVLAYLNQQPGLKVEMTKNGNPTVRIPLNGKIKEILALE